MRARVLGKASWQQSQHNTVSFYDHVPTDSRNVLDKQTGD